MERRVSSDSGPNRAPGRELYYTGAERCGVCKQRKSFACVSYTGAERCGVCKQRKSYARHSCVGWMVGGERMKSVTQDSEGSASLVTKTCIV